MSRDWDAATYDRVSGPQVAWAERLIERLDPRPHERILDAGCGSGRVTEMLIDRAGEVIACDASPSMVEAAAARLGDRAEVFRADVAAFELDEPVDAVFSNAVFHWVPDHDALFRCLHAALRPGGRLAAQCGGAGNVERFHSRAAAVGNREPFAAHLGDWTGPWNFAPAQQTAARLERAGFADVECSLEPWPVEPDEPHDYLRSVCLGYHLERLPEHLREPYVDAVLEEMGTPRLDYVRLNIDARRPA